ncbi:MAG TPA: ATP-dependent DNA ligase [Acidimicrobiia bacterium]|nr:ATP-dependent DNA ligase [Acidimicrobiia bacterium]
MSLLADLVNTSRRVSSTSSRRNKIDYLADYLQGLDDAAEIAPAVAYLSGVIPQGALGVGGATLGEPPEPASDPSLTVADVVAAFDALATTSGAGSNQRRRLLTTSLMQAATADEQAFLYGLLLGEVRQGALEGIMVEAVARASDIPRDEIRRATMLNGRIWEVAHLALAGRPEALAAVELTLFRPVKPMLAQSADTVGAAMERMEEAAVEWKLDGIRIQVHREGDRVAIYTRNLNPVTDRLGDLADTIRELDCVSLVLDGEALVLDEAGGPARFQETAGRFGTEEMVDRGMQGFFFDLLHLDGEDLIDRPLAERRARLEALAPALLIRHSVVADGDTAADVLAESLAHRHEGVVVKDLSSRYEAGRRGAAWVKVKPVHTLDLVVLAAEWGHGRRRGWLSNLHLGARGADGFVMVGKTFKGLTDELLTWQTEKLQEIEARRTRSTVFVEPRLVVEIALDGVQVSSRYPGGVALRFARVRGYRPDKDPGEADAIDTVRAMAGLPPLEA